jgi:hypothetical protein
MPSPGVQMGLFAVDEGPYQEPAAHQLVPVAETGPQHTQALGYTAGQTSQGHGLGLLGDTRSDGQSQSSLPGSAWTVKDVPACP